MAGIEQLTGIRSSKPTFYAEYRHTAESLDRALRAIDRIARVLVATAHGPEELCRSVVHATAEHVGADWTVLALRADALPDAWPRIMVRDAAGRLAHDLASASAGVRRRIDHALTVAHDGIEHMPDSSVVVPMAVDGMELGVLVACFSPDRALEEADLAILRILANQAAVALQSNDLLARSQRLHRRASDLYGEATRQAADLAERHRQLEEARHDLDSAHQREVIDHERHRIARELHDSVAQHVLSAGMTIEWCRAEVDPDGEVRQRLDHAKALTRSAVEQLRAAIYAMSHTDDEPEQNLPDMLARLTTFHGPVDLEVTTRVEGRPVRLSTADERSLFRIASECLFNTAVHGHATRVIVRLVYRADRLRLSVADDGDGDPEVLRRLLSAAGSVADGYHRGLVNMAARAAEMGGTLQFRAARLGGIRVEVMIPLPRLQEAAHG